MKLIAASTALALPTMGDGHALANPLRFFEGTTESAGTMHVLMKKTTWSRSRGRGEIAADGSLRFVQRIEEEGRHPHLRKWLIRQVAPGQFRGTMSDAKGPVSIEEIGDRYRFRFKVRGGMSVEEWITPLEGGRSATNRLSVRKFGIELARFEGLVRKLD